MGNPNQDLSLFYISANETEGSGPDLSNLSLSDSLSESTMKKIASETKLWVESSLEDADRFYWKYKDETLKIEIGCKCFRINNSKDERNTNNEFNVMRKLLGCNKIVQLKGRLENKLFENVRVVYLFMEKCTGGNLLERIIGMPKYSEKKAASIFREIVSIISTCHDKRVIHRDLKPQHFIFLTQKEDSIIKLIDFGDATLFMPGETFKTAYGTEPFGTVPYSAPELLDFEHEHGHEADIWSLGVILCVLLIGDPPFSEDVNEEDIIEEIKQCNINYNSHLWNHASKSAINLIKDILKKDPKSRISLANILEHEWVREDGNAFDHEMNPFVIRRMKRYRPHLEGEQLYSLKAIMETLSEEEFTSLKEIFNYTDTANTGTITFGQLESCLNEWGSKLKWKPNFSSDVVISFVYELDKRKSILQDGLVKYKEFASKIDEYSEKSMAS